MSYLGTCHDLIELIGEQFYCCSSCHEDDEYGYCGLIEWSDNDYVDYIEICCAAANNLEKSDIPWDALRERINGKE